ncbi:hypothetical protein CBR_g4278 [Chara braunii]|uniref:CCHC-type domain-containing protein n=1 Tax=Chara braunii TaxID=69332 RepID=A0A388JRJ3_CHABU|nr:hypothetical protein CBR_g4278 [Chara braunii]|eukprot:GBG60322.1 hypothetical protein CBR_g4278 [Chara braunii]
MGPPMGAWPGYFPIGSWPTQGPYPMLPHNQNLGGDQNTGQLQLTGQNQPGSSRQGGQNQNRSQGQGQGQGHRRGRNAGRNQGPGERGVGNRGSGYQGGNWGQLQGGANPVGQEYQQGYGRGYDQGYGRGFRRGNGSWNGQGFGRGWIDYNECICTQCGIKGHTVKRCHVRKLDERDGLITSNIDGEVFDRTGRPIDPEIPGGTRKEALHIATLGPNTPEMFRMWQGKEGSVVRVEDVTELEEKLSRMRIKESKEEVPLVEEEAEEDDVRINVRDTFDRMEDLVNKMQRLHLRLQGICEEAGEEGAGFPKVFTMGRGGLGDGPNEPNPRMLRANMAAKNSGGQRSVRGTILFATRRPAEENPSKEQAQTSQPAEEEPPIMVEGDEDEDEKIREEKERQAKIRAKRRKGEVKEGRSKNDEAPSKKRKYQTSIEEGVDLEGLVNKLLEDHNELLNLKEILASAPKLREMVKARLSRQRVASVRMGDLIPKEANWSVAESKMDWKFVGTGSIDVMIKGKMCPGMVDTGAEMSIINGETAVKLGLEVDENDCGFLNGVSGKTGYTGVASNVVIEIERVKILRVAPNSSSNGSDQAEGDELKEEEAAEGRKKSMGASVVPRKIKTEEKRPIEIGRNEAQERKSEKEGGVKKAGEGKRIQEGGKAPKVKRTEEEGPIGDREREEMSGIRKKENERDAQVEKLMRDMKEMRKEVKELKKEKEE